MDRQNNAKSRGVRTLTLKFFRAMLEGKTFFDAKPGPSGFFLRMSTR